MKAYVKCEASGLLFVRVSLRFSVSFPFSRLHPPGPSAVSQEQGQARAPEFWGCGSPCPLPRIRRGQGTRSPGALMALPWKQKLSV